MRSHALLLLVLAAAAAGRAETYDIGADFAKSEGWTRAGAAFVAEHRDSGFRFLEKGREDAARAPRSGGVTFHGLEVYESRLWFATSGVARIELSLYNRGDADRPLTAADLGEKLAAVRRLFDAAGAKSPRVEAQNVGNGVQQFRQTWRSPAPAQLVWRGRKVAGGRVDADFVRVTLLPPGGMDAGAQGFAVKARARGKAAIRENVVKVTAATAEEGRTKDGDVFVGNVPMVDQGDKGYCAVATCERVLRYYGLAVDEHELGASAGSTASGGTSLQAMYETVSALAKKFGLGTHLVYGELDKDVSGRIHDLEKQVADYNKAAKKLRRPEIARSQYVRGGVMWDAAAAQAAMEPVVLKAMKLKLPAFRVFQRALHDQVNAGIPLVWSVTLGIFPEPDIPQAQGGHMRLIIGYNDRTKEIIYTDSWGAGHECKHMPLDDAWAISKAVLFIKPNRK